MNLHKLYIRRNSQIVSNVTGVRSIIKLIQKRCLKLMAFVTGSFIFGRKSFGKSSFESELHTYTRMDLS